MSVKSVFHSFRSFLDKHTGDLNALTDALQAMLSALPVNAGTRDSINATIDRVQASANNIADWLENGDADGAVVQISETDLENAVAKRVAELLPGAVADYMAANGFEVVHENATEQEATA